MITARLQGGREVVRAQQEWTAETIERVKFVVWKYAVLGQNRSKQLTPVDEGHLRNSIGTLFEDDGLTGMWGTNLFYAPYVEFGTGVFAVNGAGRQTPWVYFSERLGRFVRTTGSRPQPFILPSFNQTAPEFRNAVLDVLKEATR